MIQLHTLSTFPPKNPFDRFVPCTDLSFMGALTDEEHLENAVGQAQAVYETNFATPFPSSAICKGCPQGRLWQDKSQDIFEQKRKLIFYLFQISSNGWACEE